jgi:hypothetical protein
MKLQPFDLLDFFFLTLIATIAGTLAVIVPFPAAPVEPAPRPPVVAPVAAPPPPVSEKERGALEGAGAALLREWDLTAAQLQSAQTEAQRLAEEMRQRQELIEKLRQLAGEKHKDSGAIEEKLAASQAENLRKATEAERLNQLMKQKRNELTQVEEELRRTANPVGDAAPGGNSQRATVARETDKEAEVMEFVGDRAVPVDKDHFAFLRLGDAVLAVRKEGVTGEAAGEMEKPGSKFLNKLKGLDKNKQFLFCLVNDDSFKAFRRARRIAQGMQIGVGWEPYDSKDRKIVFGRGGRKPTEPR